jgi:protein-tyrosine-phosphatase
MSDRAKIIEVMARAGASFEEVEYEKFSELFIEQAEYMLALLEKSGMAVVPVEPTQAMINAGMTCMTDDDGELPDIWAAMIAAASKEIKK